MLLTRRVVVILFIILYSSYIPNSATRCSMSGFMFLHKLAKLATSSTSPNASSGRPCSYRSVHTLVRIILRRSTFSARMGWRGARCGGGRSGRGRGGGHDCKHRRQNRINRNCRICYYCLYSYDATLFVEKPPTPDGEVADSGA